LAQLALAEYNARSLRRADNLDSGSRPSTTGPDSGTM